MTIVGGESPYVKEWIKEKLGVEILAQTAFLSKPQKQVVRRMMSPKKFSNIIADKSVRWNKAEELKRVALEIFGDADMYRVLFFSPSRDADAVAFLLK